MTKEDIQNLIAGGRLTEALKVLPSVLDASLQNEVIQLQSRLSTLEREERMGLLSNSDASRERSRITVAALSLLSQKPPVIPPPSNLQGNITQHHSGIGDNVAGDKIGKPPSGSKPAVQKKSILFAAANPSDEARLLTDVEFRTIKEEMQLGQQRDLFQFLPVALAVRIKELTRSLKAKPTIIHFSGHGEQEGIIISNDDNEGLVLTDNIIGRLFKRLVGHTELVLLNSCYSAIQAKMISQLGMIVIGHNLPIGDKAALNFAKGLYLGLGEGMSYEEAYGDGIIAVLTENDKYADVVEVWKDGEKMDW